MGSHNCICKRNEDRCHRRCFQHHPSIFLIAQAVYTIAQCSGGSPPTCKEYLECKLGPYWQTPDVKTFIPRAKWEWNGLMLVEMWPSHLCLLFLTSMFLIGPFPGSGSMTSTLNISHFTEDDPHGNPLYEYFLLNTVTFL